MHLAGFEIVRHDHVLYGVLVTHRRCLHAPGGRLRNDIVLCPEPLEGARRSTVGIASMKVDNKSVPAGGNERCVAEICVRITVGDADFTLVEKDRKALPIAIGVELACA